MIKIMLICCKTVAVPALDAAIDEKYENWQKVIPNMAKTNNLFASFFQIERNSRPCLIKPIITIIRPAKTNLFGTSHGIVMPLFWVKNCPQTPENPQKMQAVRTMIVPLVIFC